MGTHKANGRALPSQEEVAPANDPKFQFKPQPVKRLVLNEGAEKIQRANESAKTDELWLGTAFDPSNLEGDDIPVYVRIANPMPVAAELLCSVIGRALGLPVPEPFVVQFEVGSLVGSSMKFELPQQLAFASYDIGGDTFSQLLTANSPAASRMLRAWKHLIPVATFDEWLANRDRNLGNILFVANALWIIDHAEAFHGSARGLWDLCDLTTDAVHNVLAGCLASDPVQVRAQYLEDSENWISSCASRLSVEDAVVCSDLEHLQTPEQQQDLIKFISNRLTVTHTLLCNRLGHPQLKG